MRRTPVSYHNPTSIVEPAWYCLRAKAKHEHIVAAHLRELCDVTVFCPRVRFKRQTRQGVAWVTEALFPSYLFARFPFAELHRQVEYTPGVIGMVRFAGRYPTIEDGVVAELQEYVGIREMRELSYAPSPGDSIQIAHGAFAGLEAIVTRILSAKERVKVLMEFLGRKMEAEIACSSILQRGAAPAFAAGLRLAR